MTLPYYVNGITAPTTSGIVLARIPEDNGKRIWYGSAQPFVVKDGLCEGYNPDDDCSNTAVVVVQGDTDSFGFEFFHLCKTCAAKYGVHA